MQRLTRVGVFLLAVSLLLTYSGAGEVGALAPPSQHAALSASGCASMVQLMAYDSLTWSNTSIGPVCKTVTFTVVNTGSTQHTFTVSAMSNVTDNSSTDNTFFTTHYVAGAGPGDDLNASATVTVTLTFYGPGAYEFTCMPHYGLGMFGEIYVDESPPAAPAPPPSFEPFWYIVIIISTLAVLCVVLGIIYGKRSPEDESIPEDAPITAKPEYYNDSRPEPLDVAEPMKRGGDEH